MTGDWKTHAYSATVDLAAAHLAKTNSIVIAHLRDAADNIYKAIDAVENEEKTKS